MGREAKRVPMDFDWPLGVDGIRLPPPPPPPPPSPGPWQAEITACGAGSWSVRFTNGLINYGPDGGSYQWFGSRERVTRKARRLLARLEGPASETFAVRSGS